MSKTNINWTDFVANPFPGCKKVSEGCRSCYAEKMAKRLKAMGRAAYQDVVDENGWTGKVGCNLDAMKVPGKGKMVFVQSMGDLFYERVTDAQILMVYNGIRRMCLDGHTAQVLTKRPERAALLLPQIEFNNAGKGSLYLGQVRPVPFVKLLSRHWFGVTAENQEWADRRIPILRQIPAAVRFVSLEPLLDLTCIAAHLGCVHDYDTPRTDWVDWVIVGCESGPHPRECKLEWVEWIVRQCREYGVPVFVKAIQLDKRIVSDAHDIAQALGYSVEQIRQWPKGRA